MHRSKRFVKNKTLPKYEPVYKVEVKDEAGVIITEVDKLLYVRRKDAPRQQRSTS